MRSRVEARKRRDRRRWVRGVAGAAAALGVMLALPLAGAAEGQEYTVAPYLSNSGAESLTLDLDGNLVLVNPGAGNMDGEIDRLIDLNGNGTIDNEAEQRPVAVGLPSLAEFDEETGELGRLGVEAAAWSPNGDLYFVTNAFWPDFTQNQFGAIWSTVAPNTSTNPLRIANPYASLENYEATVNPDGLEVNPNPFRLVVDADGNAYVNDAGGNVTLKVAPDGTISTYALYPMIEVPAELGIPIPFAEPVPTGIAFGPDGALYVGQLSGAPFLPETASIYRLEDLNGDGDAMDDGEMTVFAAGLTTVTDIAFGPDGSLYASEFRGFLTASEDGPPPADGDVVKWTADGWETVATDLMMPTSIRVGPDNSLYILTIDGMIWRGTPAG